MAHSRAPLRWGALLLVLTSLAFGLLHAESSIAAGCDNSWDGSAGDGLFTTASNWSLNHVPAEPESACIGDMLTGDYTVTLNTSALLGSLTIGGASGTQKLVVTGNTLLRTKPGDLTLNSHGEFTVNCSAVSSIEVQVLGKISNGGKITTMGTCLTYLEGDLDNTGTLQIDHETNYRRADSPTVTLDNKGTIAVANGVTFEVDAGNCAGPQTTLINDVGGQINAAGTGNLLATNYKQGAGTTSGTGPVKMECGFLEYTGAGASTVVADQGSLSGLSGASHAGQSLTLSSSAGGIVALAPGGFTNGGQLTFDCPMAGCAGNGPNIQLGSNTLVNTGTFTVTARASGNPAVYGNLTNTGTLQIDGDARHAPDADPSTELLNQGVINIGNGATFTSSGSSCASTGTQFTNDTGGQINATGTGTLAPVVYNQGAGTTSGNNPVTLDCNGNTLNYTGTGASRVLVAGGGNAFMTGNLANGQSLEIHADSFGNSNLNAGSFTNAGAITIDRSGGISNLNMGTSTLTNTGTLTIAPSGMTPAAITVGTITSSGSIDVGSDANVSGAISNQGTIDVAANQTLTTNNGFAQTAGTTSLGGGTAKLQAVGGGISVQGGTLGGMGTLQGPVTNGGTVRPGSVSTPGTLTVTGSYTQQALGVLNARVASSANDLLNVSGASTLAGTLAISTVGGFSPPVGQSYTVLSDGSQSGQFGTVTGASSGPYDVVYDPTAVKLVATEKPLTPGLTFSIDDPGVVNPGTGDATLMFTVTLSAASVGTTSVDFATANGTAAAPGDYEAQSGTLSFAPGETQKTIGVTVHGVSAPGQDRTLFVNLTAPTNATILRGQGTGTIFNDRAVVRSISPTTGGAGGVTTVTLRGEGFSGNPTFKLVRSGQPDTVPTDVSATGHGRTITGTLDLKGAATGDYDVVVTFSGAGISQTIPNGFKVEATKPPKIAAEVVGPGVALRLFPYTALIQYTNSGNVDAHNTLIRIDGLQHRARVDIIGRGASALELDSTDDHSVVVAIDRIAAGSTGGVLMRFTAVGPAHSDYWLESTVLQDSAPSTSLSSATDPPIQVTKEVMSTSDTAEKGILHVTGPFPPGDISYDLEIAEGSVGPPKLTETTSGDNTHVELDLSDSPPATEPPIPSGPGVPSAAFKLSARHLKLSYDAAKKVTDAMALYNKFEQVRQFTLSRHHINECLRNRHIITKEGYAELENWAAAGQTITILNEVVANSPAESIAGGDFGFPVLASVGEKAWELKLAGFGSGAFGGSLLTPIELFSQQTDTGPNAIFTTMTPQERLKYVVKLCLPVDPRKRKRVSVRNAGDPNDKTGPSGFGSKHYIARGAQLPYNIRFENKPEATAPAHEVTVTDQLDASKVDLSTVALGPVFFGDRIATPPPGAQAWTDSVDLRPEKNLIVSIDAAADTGTGLITWHFAGLDPATGLLQTDPDLGFLPPDTKPPNGQGGVSFTVRQKAGLKHKAKIANGARIVFDREAPIETPTWSNSIDTTRPTSRVKSVKHKRKGRACRNLKVSWRGKDTGAGIYFWDVYVAQGSGKFKLWRFHTARRSARYRTRGRGVYRFSSVATDGVGHVQKNRKAGVKKIKLSC